MLQSQPPIGVLFHTTYKIERQHHNRGRRVDARQVTGKNSNITSVEQSNARCDHGISTGCECTASGGSTGHPTECKAHAREGVHSELGNNARMIIAFHMSHCCQEVVPDHVMLLQRLVVFLFVEDESILACCCCGIVFQLCFSASAPPSPACWHA